MGELWSQPEIEQLTSNYMNMTDLEIGNELERSKNGVRWMRKQLHLMKDGKKFIIQSHQKNLSVNLAYILGALNGDGHIGKQLVLSVVDKDFILAYKRAVEKQFGINVKLGKKIVKEKKWKSQYRVMTGCSDITNFIGNFNLNKILKAPKPIKCAFLRGIYDAEGWISLRKNKIVLIGFGNTNKSLINLVSTLLTDLDIIYKKSIRIFKNKKWKQCEFISIFGKSNYIKFRDNIGFSIKRKQDRLELQHLPKWEKFGGVV